MNNVINMFEARKRIAQKKGDVAGYNSAEVMKKNHEQKKKLEEQRVADAQRLADMAKRGQL